MNELYHLSQIYPPHEMPENMDLENPYCLMMVVNKDKQTDTMVSIQIVKVRDPVKFDNLDFVHAYIEKTMNANAVIENSDEQEVASLIAKNSMRGEGNHKYHNMVIYHGTSVTDAAFFVQVKDGIYHVYCNPNLPDYIGKIE